MGDAELDGAFGVVQSFEGFTQERFVAQAGGPGTTATLTVSGLTFHETLLEGQITVH